MYRVAMGKQQGVLIILTVIDRPVEVEVHWLRFCFPTVGSMPDRTFRPNMTLLR